MKIKIKFIVVTVLLSSLGAFWATSQEGPAPVNADIVVTGGTVVVNNPDVITGMTVEVKPGANIEIADRADGSSLSFVENQLADGTRVIVVADKEAE